MSGFVVFLRLWAQAASLNATPRVTWTLKVTNKNVNYPKTVELLAEMIPKQRLLPLADERCIKVKSLVSALPFLPRSGHGRVCYTIPSSMPNTKRSILSAQPYWPRAHRFVHCAPSVTNLCRHVLQSCGDSERTNETIGKSLRHSPRFRRRLLWISFFFLPGQSAACQAPDTILSFFHFRLSP